MRDHRALETAHQAAELLPGPPPSHDPFGYLAWEELVIATARRLRCLVDLEQLLPVATENPALTLRPRSARLDAQALLVLASLLTHSDDSSACEGVLSRAVASCRQGHCGVVDHARESRLRVRGRLDARGFTLSPRV